MLSSELFAETIDTAKVRAGVRTDAEMCRAIGISPQRFSIYRRKPSSIPLPILSMICNYLNIPVKKRGKLLI